MFDLLTASFWDHSGEDHGSRDIEMATQHTATSYDNGLDEFFQKIEIIKEQYKMLNKLLKTLKVDHEKSKAVANAAAVKEIEQRMDKHVKETRKIALFIKSKLEELDKENLTNRQKTGCGKGSAVERSRTNVTAHFKKKLKDKMSEFQALNEHICKEHREVVERRYNTVTGNRADKETIDLLIVTRDTEHFQNALQGQGRKEVLDTVAEIQERQDAIVEVERNLLELQEIFNDMAILVDDQGEMLDNIEMHVTSAVDYVDGGNKALHKAKSLQKNSRKWKCIAILILLIIIAGVVVGMLKPWKSRNGA